MVSWTGFENIVRQGEPLAMHTWFQLGGPAEYFAEPENPDQLIALLQRSQEQGVEVRVLGQGSNVLIRDEGVRGLIVRLTALEFGRIEIDGQRVTVGGGANLGRLVTTAVHRGLAGMEMLVGIPGTVGGALHGNTGTHGGDIGQWTASATMITAAGETIERSRDDLVFGYRESSLDETVILSATLVLEEDDPRELAKRMQKQWIIKRANQPMGHQCAGCIFKNPRGASAGRVDRDVRPEGHPHRRGGRQRAAREFHCRRTRLHQPGRAALDRPGPQSGQRSDGRAAGTGSRDLVNG